MKNIRSFVMGFLCAVLIIALAAGVLAVAVRGTITTAGPSVKVDGTYAVFGPGTFRLDNGCDAPSSLSYRDEKGGGTTYIPLRKISEVLGVKVEWDQATQTVILTTGDGEKGSNQQGTIPDSSNKTADGLEQFLNEKAGMISTPWGEFTATISVTKNLVNYNPYDYQIHVGCNFPFYSLKYSVEYTDEEKEQVINSLREYQYNLYTLAEQYFPDAKITGGFYSGYYKYENIKEGYTSTRVFSWCNYTDGVALNYDEASITYFHWNTTYDDYVFD